MKNQNGLTWRFDYYLEDHRWCKNCNRDNQTCKNQVGNLWKKTKLNRSRNEPPKRHTKDTDYVKTEREQIRREVEFAYPASILDEKGTCRKDIKKRLN